MSIKKVVFAGCSLTAGAGWNPNDFSARVIDHPNLWVNLCHQNINQIKNLELYNIGIAGASNAEIFQNVVETISKFDNEIDTLFCQWTSYPRYNFNVDFELWNTDESIHSQTGQKTHDVSLRRGDVYSREYIQDLTDRLLILHHHHWCILEIVKFTNIIKSLANKLNIKNLYFINGICHWDTDYFKRLENVSPENYTSYTKHQIININQRNDENIIKLYNLAHDQYDEAGGIDPKDWINLYNSFRVNRIDRNFDNLHPGIKSNQIYFKIVDDYFKK